MSNKKPKRKAYIIPADKISKDAKMKNGEEYSNRAVGAYYASGLEVSFVGTPQYNNAGDLLAPMDDEVKKVFKPARPYGVFGALVEDDNASNYQLESGRMVVELTSKEEVLKVADSINAGTQVDEISDEIKSLTYTKKDGTKISYMDAIKEQASYRKHNDIIQKKIDDLIKLRGFAPEVKDGKKISYKYPESLLSEIAEIAMEKKSITGFCMKIQVFGKHTIATDNNYYKSSISQAELDKLTKKLNYVNKETYTRGTVRAGTIIIPIQTIAQLKIVKRVMEGSFSGYLQSWPKHVIDSCIWLEKEDR